MAKGTKGIWERELKGALTRASSYNFKREAEEAVQNRKGAQPLDQTFNMSSGKLGTSRFHLAG